MAGFFLTKYSQLRGTMFNIVKNLSPDTNQLNTWLGAENVEHLSKSMQNWYGPPIIVSGMPGEIFIHGDGDFSGFCRAGYEATALDRASDILRRIKRGARIAASPRRAQLNAGFASLSDLISEATGGKRQDISFSKTGNTGVVAATNTLWRVGASPAAGAQPTTANGTAVTVANTGSMPFINASSWSGTDTAHFVGGYPTATTGGNTLLLYDRLTHHLKTMNTTASESVANNVTRYSNTTSTTAADYAAGNFIFIETGGTALAATAHNWGNSTVACQYTNQAGTTAQNLPVVTGNSGNIGDRLDMPTGTWFCPLATGDTGVKGLTQMQCSAAVATGIINFVVGHPIAWLPCPVANMVCQVDGINTAFNLARIFDGAALAFLEVCKPATTATTYSGTITICSG